VTRALGVRGRGRQASIARALVGTPVLRRPIAQAVAALLGAGLIAILPFASPGAAASRVLTPGGDTARPTTAYATVPNALWQPTGLGWYSSNWAGYAVANGPYRSVGGRWTVPQVAVSNGRGFSALWIGVDGFSNDSLIQAGTESDVYGGTTHYSAWWEILPAPAVVIRGLSIRAGDHIAASIARVSAGRWRITIRDARSGTYTTTRSYAGPGTSAEWIEEAPVVDDRPTPLAEHGTVVFDEATVNGSSPHLLAADGGAMIRRGVVADIPSAPNGDGNGFSLSELGSAVFGPAS